MKKLCFNALAVAIAATMAGAVLAGSDNDAATLKQISGYRQWTRVNPEPVKVEVPVTTAGTTTSIPLSMAV